jgi:hypothetical protein
MALASAATSAVAAVGGDVAPETGGLRLVCSGTMTIAGVDAPPQKVSSGGIVDFDGMRVDGFGMGSEPIVYVSPARIDFGSATAGGHGEGSIDRATGATRVSIRQAGDPTRELFTMRLECSMMPWPASG